MRTYALTMMHAGVIAAGDVNNDGVDEIVAAGYVDRTKSDTSDYHASVTLTDGKVSKVSYCSNFSGYSLVSCVIKRNGSGYGKSKLAIIDMCQAHRYTHNEYCNNKDWIFTKLAIACAKTNGDNQAEDVCIDGVIYDFSKSTPKVKHTPTYLTSDMSTSVGNGLFTSVNFVRRLAAGNFNGNDAGREQFIFTFWQKVKGENLYASAIGVLCGVDYDDKTSGGKVTSYGPPKYYGSSFNVSGGLFVPQVGTIYTTDRPAEYCYLIHVMSETSNPINATPVAVDVDDDGVLGRFSKKGYVYWHNF